MKTHFLLARIPLTFASEHAEQITDDLSAVVRDDSGYLWLASDELIGERVILSRLAPGPSCSFDSEARFALGDFIDLPGDDEADIEALDCSDGYLWFTGSHALKRKRPKNPSKTKQSLQRLATINTESNRYVLGRIPLQQGVPVRSMETKSLDRLTAAALDSATGENGILAALKADDHLATYISAPIPGKENGFDIEGLAVRGDRVFLGLRGPVLRGWSLVLDVRLEEAGPGRLDIASQGKRNGGRSINKHFLNLDGLGVRDLCWHKDDLLILAGPTMTLDGATRIYRWRDPEKHANDSLTDQGGRALEPLIELPSTLGSDYAEGLCLTQWFDEDALLVVYDRPAEDRKHGARTVYADVFRL